MAKYCRILEEVEAVEAREDNAEELQALVGDCIAWKVVPMQGFYIVPRTGDIVEWGNFLIKHPSGRLEVMLHEVFHEMYEPKI